MTFRGLCPLRTARRDLTSACGLLLLISRKPKYGPTKAQEIVVPLAATFSSMVFDQTFPCRLADHPLDPGGWRYAAGGGRGRRFCGRSARFFRCGRSCGWGGRWGSWFRSARSCWRVRIVRCGTRFTLDTCFCCSGMFMTACTVRMTLLAGGAFALSWWRARLEEAVLSAHSAVYREWMKHTGFLWPVGAAAPSGRGARQLPIRRNHSRTPLTSSRRKRGGTGQTQSSAFVLLCSRLI